MGNVNIPGHRKPSSGPTTCSEFADRVEQSVALCRSMEFVESVLRADRELTAYQHVLTFYGGSGMGKTALSARLQAWLDGHLADDNQWGPPPKIANIATVRWDMHASQGDVDIVHLLLAFRSQLPPIPGGWTVLDLALLAYFQAARPGQSLSLSAKGDEHGWVDTVIGAVANDLGYVLDLGTGLASAAIQEIVKYGRKKLSAKKLAQFPAAATLIERCLREVNQLQPSPELAADILGLADDLISAVDDPLKRPLVVVFIDHFEFLQVSGRRLGEATINRLVATLPQCLFVITGRNRLDWDDPTRTALQACGGALWPNLALGDGPDPRQHNLGRLSEHDTRDVLMRRQQSEGFSLDEVTMRSVIARTAGWPVHIDAVCTTASNEANGTDAVVPGELLDKPLPDLVRRLLENLTDNQARAYHGMSLLPYFDLPLAAKAAGVPQGDVAGCLNRTMVEPHTDPRWPYRVHDQIREIIRHAPADIKGGWTDSDRQEAAHRVLGELRSLLAEAAGREDDLEVTRYGGLAIRIAAEQGIWQDWLLESAFLDSSPQALFPLVPRSSNHPDTAALLEFIQTRVAGGDRELDDLEKLGDSGAKVARYAYLWRAYGLRDRGHYDDALEQLRNLTNKGYRRPNGDLWAVPRSQIGITMNQARRFEDALNYASSIHLTAGQAAYIRDNQRLILAPMAEGEVGWDERLAEGSWRFRVERMAGHSRWLARRGEGDRKLTVHRLSLARNIGYRAAQRTCHYALACIDLADEETFEQHLAEVLEITTPAEASSASAVHLLCFRAFLTEDDAHIRRAVDAMSSVGLHDPQRIPAECLLDALGHPVDSPPTQWVVPYETVKQRWVDVAQTVVAAAKASKQ